jgi:hypothetical protein
MKIYDIAKVIRSKNAGPFTLTIDMIFESEHDFERVANADLFNKGTIASLYKTSAEKIQIHLFKRILAIKIALPRAVSSGAPEDVDVYGSQQHFPLAEMDL